MQRMASSLFILECKKEVQLRKRHVMNDESNYACNHLMSSGSTTTQNPKEDESEELVRFREEWKKEVRQKKGARTGSDTTPGPSYTVSSESSAPNFLPTLPRPQPEPKVHIDRIDHRYELLASAQQLQSADSWVSSDKAPSEANTSVDHDHDNVMEDLTKTMQQKLSMQKPSQHSRALLTSILANFPAQLEFMPEDEKEPVHMKLLPEELLLAVLRIMDPASIERFAAVSRKARYITLDTSIWR
jgi:hypothetical protein